MKVPEEKKVKGCCICKEERKAMENCVAEYGPGNCDDFIKAYNECRDKMNAPCLKDEKKT